MAKSLPTLQVPFLASKEPDSALTSQICGWADEGEIERAGQNAESQLRGGRYNAEIFMIWLAFRFARAGLAELPSILRDLEAQARVSRGSAEGTQKAFARGLAWLSENLRVRLKFHAKFHDAHWHDWCGQLSLQLAAELAEALARLGETDSPLREFAEGVELLYRKTFGTLLEDLRVSADAEPPSLAEQEPVSHAEPAAPAVATLEEQTEDGEQLEPPSWVAAREPAEPQVSSVALEALRTKLAAFERLVAEQAWPVAAMVARDVEQELSEFDPIRYFPGVFSGYLRTLSAVGAELEQYMQPGGSLESQALERLYRADPELFLATLSVGEASSA